MSENSLLAMALNLLFFFLLCMDMDMQPHLAFAQEKLGFLSLDCGLESGQNYTDENGLTWVSDAAFLQPTGLEEWSKTVTLNVLTDLGVNQQALKTLRYFPGGLANQSKYCYDLPGLIKGQYYLLRLVFYYGNYDNQGRNPLVLGLVVDANLWPVIITTPDIPLWKELYVPATSERISVCVAKTDPNSEPFISSLELRPLDDRMNIVRVLQANNTAVDLYFRINYGENSSRIIRYPHDSFDRIWYPEDTTMIARTATDRVVNTGLLEVPPSLVLQTALGGGNKSNLWRVLNITSEFQLIFINSYFSEIDNSVISGGQRVFDIYMNGAPLLLSFDILNHSTNKPFEAVGMYTTKALMMSNILNFSYYQSPNSLYPPIISALEVMRISDAPLSLGTSGDDVSVIQDIQKSFEVLTNWSGDPCLPYQFNWLTCSSESPPRITALILSNYNLSGSIPSSLNELLEVQRISLDRNELTGPIPDLSNLLKLQTLDLSNNLLSGSIPPYLGSLPGLSVLYLQNNNLSGQIPQSLVVKNRSSVFSFEYQENPYLCIPGDTSCAGVLPDESEKDALPGYIIGIIIAAVIIFVLGASGIIAFVVNKFGKVRNHANTVIMANGKAGNHSKEPFSGMDSTRLFTYNEIQVATRNFSNKLGEGGYGPVYFGTLNNSHHVAVKLLSKTSHQGSEQFTNEVNILSRVRHRNLVSLLGYCTDKELILVYELMSGGTLRDHLYGNRSSNPLNWEERLIIVLGAAQGLDYLHTMSHPGIIHRDVKSDNILLDDNSKAKVSDFGISKSKPTEDATHVATRVIGTAGYLDPEYSVTNILTDKSDVYSFGVVLMEIMCGRPPILPDLRHIAEWVQSNVEICSLEDIMDPALRGGQYNLESVWKVAELGLRCTNQVGAMRPTMSEVVSEVNYALELELHILSSAVSP